MTSISTKTFLGDPIHFFNLARREDLAIKRGKVVFQLMVKPEFENPSPSGDPYWDDPRNVAEAERLVKEFRTGKMEFVTLTPELKKQMFG